MAERIEDSGERIRQGFESQFVTVPVAKIVPLKTLPEGAREGRTFAQVLSSIKAIGLVEAPVVMADTSRAGSYFLLDGHLRTEALKQLGIEEVECLIATEDDTYTYNKRVNRIPPIQEHRMIARAMERGVPAADIAEAVNLQVESVIRRFRLLDGISAEAAEMLKDTPCSMRVFDILRQMSAVRQIEAADLMIGQNNFPIMFAAPARRPRTISWPQPRRARARPPRPRPASRLRAWSANWRRCRLRSSRSRRPMASTICI